MTQIEQDGHRFLFVMLNGVKHLPLTKTSGRFFALLRMTDKNLLVKHFKSVVILFNLCHLCAFQTAR